MCDLSVIIATKNEQDYLEKTLKHLTLAMEETEKSNVKAELIVVDSSNDDTPSKAREFTEKVYHLSLQGVSKARNLGARLSKGSVLVFMDADTLVQKNTLIDIFNVFSCKKSVVSLITFVQPTSNNEIGLSEKLFYIVDKLFIKAIGVVGFLPHFYNRGDAVAIRRNVFNAIGGFNEELYMMEIAQLLVKASKYGPVRVLPSPVFDSTRRLRMWGVIRSHKIWWINYFTFYVLNRLHDATYEMVR